MTLGLYCVGPDCQKLFLPAILLPGGCDGSCPELLRANLENGCLVGG